MFIDLSCLVIVKSVECHLFSREGEVPKFTGWANEASLWPKTNEGESTWSVVPHLAKLCKYKYAAHKHFLSQTII